jgi:hypothetical protein
MRTVLIIVVAATITGDACLIPQMRAGVAEGAGAARVPRSPDRVLTQIHRGRTSYATIVKNDRITEGGRTVREEERRTQTGNRVFSFPHLENGGGGG